jgi:membrane associated rhomboid family serine protease
MLADRYYMRHPRFRSPWSATVGLLVANVAVFVLELIRYGPGLRFPAGDYFALSTDGLAHGYVWQLLTYQFMHAGWMHLAVNCWMIYIFGREVEETLGRGKYLTLYFSSGVFGGLCQALGGVVAGGVYAAPTVGASAAGFGVLAAFATLYPERPLMLFPLPMTLRAKFLLLFGGLLAVFGIIFPADNIAHAAHLGGMLTGIVFVRYAMHWNYRLPRMPKFRKQPLRASAGSARRTAAPWAQDSAEEELPPEEFFSKNVDPILDKISAQGIQSLTERERRILQAARDRMAKR